MTFPNKSKIFQTLLVLSGFVFFALMLVYSYQGWFTRYMADDYCNAVLFRNPVQGLINRYLSGFGGNRYSNIWLVGVSEFLGGIKSIPWLPVVHIFLWGVGLFWAMSELKQLLKLEWNFAAAFFAALSILFFTLIQAPNLYQTVYWRSSMTTHFAPVVYGTLLTAYLLRGANRAKTEDFSAKTGALAFVSAFVVGGFSEPADATQITLLTLALAAVWRRGKAPARERTLKLLAWTLGGALLSLLVMSVSPANFRRLGGDPHSVTQVLGDSILYAYIFLYKTFAELPLPSLLSVLVPALFMALSFGREFNQNETRALALTALAIPPLAYLLIVAGFSPSALGQGYPVPRMQFYARLITVLALMTEGALLGIFLAPKTRRPVWQGLMLILFFFAAVLYPARAVGREYGKTPEYQLRAEKWDKRDALIYELKAQGQTRLTVPQFGGVYGVKELDTFATHWVNKCAARYYGVESIRAIPMGDD